MAFSYIRMICDVAPELRLSIVYSRARLPREVVGSGLILFLRPRLDAGCPAAHEHHYNLSFWCRRECMDKKVSIAERRAMIMISVYLDFP